MPLNQLQRRRIDPYIAHFFYDLSSEPHIISSLRTALEKPFTVTEQKASDEHASDFDELTTFITQSQKKIKAEHDKKFEELNPEPVTLYDVTEYIIFYSLCCLHFHIEQSNTDDFDFETWLQTHGITKDELNASWQPHTWLKRIGTDTTLERVNWNIDTTLHLLNQHRNTNRFITAFTPPIDHIGSGIFNWDLPELKERTYSAKILPKMHHITDAAGNIIEVQATLDLVIQTHISSESSLKETITDFKPYPNASAMPNETVEQQALRDMHNHIQQEIIKEEAAVIAEKKAIHLILNSLDLIDITEPLPKFHSTPNSDDDDNLEFDSHTPEIPVPPSYSGNSPSVPDESIAELNAIFNNQSPRNNSPIAPSAANTSPASPAISNLSVNNPIEQLDTTAPGMKLLTYQFYYDELQANYLTLTDLETFSVEEVNNLTADVIRSLIAKRHLTINQGKNIKSHVKQLLEIPYYLQHFCTHAEELSLINNITSGQASFLRLPVITNLQLQNKLLLQNALTISPLAFPICKELVYANYLREYPEAISLLQNITPTQQEYLLNATTKEMIARRLISLSIALMLTQKQMQLIEHCAFKSSFLTSNVNYSLLTNEKIDALLQPKIITLVDLRILSAENALRHSIEQIDLHCNPQIYKLLLIKKISSNQVAAFTPLRTALVETDPYTSLLKNHIGNETHTLLLLPDEDLEYLLQPKIKNLIGQKILTLNDIINAKPQLREFFNGERTYSLLIRSKITAKQVAELTHTTWQQIEDNYDSYLFLSTDTPNTQTNISLKIWSQYIYKHLKSAYMNVYRNTQKETSQYADIDAQIQIIASRENIPKSKLQEHVIALLLPFIHQQISSRLQGIQPTQIPLVYTKILNTIDNATQYAEPNQLTTLREIARHAEQGITALKTNPRNCRQTHTFFQDPFVITHHGIKHYCNKFLRTTNLILSMNNPNLSNSEITQNNSHRFIHQ